MTAPVIAYRPHIHQARVHASEAQFRVVAAGRQSGKTLTGVAEESEWAFSRPGELFWWVTASSRTEEKCWRDLTSHIPKSIIRKTSESKGALSIDLKNKSRIAVRSAEAEDSLVSETLGGIVCDEFSLFKPHVWPQLLRPMLGTTHGPALFLLSPRGRNHAYDLYQLGLSGDRNWASFHWRSDQSPYFSREEFERAKRQLPERIFQQEYEAVFLDGGGEVFRHVDTAIAPYAPRDDYTVMGVDLGRVRDFTVLWAMNSAGETVEVQRFTDLDWSIQKVRIIEMAVRLQVRRVLIDATGMHVGADAVVNDLQAAYIPVEPVVISAPVKRAMVEGLMVRFDTGAIRIPAEAAEEFRAFTFETSRSGHDRYSAPSGRHDDYVMGCALAAWGIRHFAGRPVLRRKPEDEVQREMRELWEEEGEKRRGGSEQERALGGLLW